MQVYKHEGQCNSYLLCHEGSALLIDAGAPADVLLEWADQVRATITHILITHRHFDHLLGLEGVRQATGAPVYVHQLDAGLTHADVNLSRMAGMPFACSAPEHELQGDEVLMLNGIQISVHHTPGHTPGCVCYHTGQGIFTGDFIFLDSIGRVDLPQGDDEMMRRSLRAFVQAGYPDQPLYPGHGAQTTYLRECGYNPFLRL